MHWIGNSIKSFSVNVIFMVSTALLTIGCPGTHTKPTVPAGSIMGRADSRCLKILFDRTIPMDFAIGPAQAILLANILSHFQFDEKLIQAVDTYQAGQLNQCTYNFYLGTVYNNPLPPSFLADAVATPSSLVWMGYNIWQLGPQFQAQFQYQYLRLTQLDYLHRDPLGYPSFFSEVLYKQTPFAKYIRRLAYGQVSAAHEIAIVRPLGPMTNPPLALAINPVTGERIPYIIQSGNKYYVAESPFSFLHEGDRVNVLTDLLFQILHRPPSIGAPRVGFILSYKESSNNNSINQLIIDELTRRGIPYFVSYAPMNQTLSTPLPSLVESVISHSQGVFWDIANLKKGLAKNAWYSQLAKQQERFFQIKILPISILDSTPEHTLIESNELANLFPVKLGRAEAFALTQPSLNLKNMGRKPFLFPLPNLSFAPTNSQGPLPFLSASFHHHQFSPTIIYGDLFGQTVVPILGSMTSSSDVVKLNQDINSIAVIGDSFHFIQIPLDDINPAQQLQTIKQTLEFYQAKQFHYIDRTQWHQETSRHP